MTPFDRFLSIMLRPWIAGSYLVFVTLSVFYFDRPVAEFLYALNLNARFPPLHWLTMLGAGVMQITLFFLIVMFFRFIRPNKTWETRSWFLWFCVLLPNLVSLVLKIMLGRARPELWFEDKLYGFYGMHFTRHYWSFPSGHTTTIMGLMLGLGIVFPRYFYWFLVSGLMVNITRILLTQHYLSDVMMTSYLVLLEIGLILLYSRRKNHSIVQSLES